MKFKVGDVVRGIKKSAHRYGVTNEYMYRGKIVGIRDNGYIDIEILEHRNKNKIGQKYIYLDPKYFKLVNYTYEDLKKSPIGTKITFEDGKFNIRRNEKWFTGEYPREIADLKNLKDNYGERGKIIKIEEPEYTTVYEYKPEILDKVEKRYLRGVIRPFRSKVLQIAKKYDCFTELEYIKITIKDDASLEFPSFSKNTMYKNMEINKKYTLEELGL